MRARHPRSPETPEQIAFIERWPSRCLRNGLHRRRDQPLAASRSPRNRERLVEFHQGGKNLVHCVYGLCERVFLVFTLRDEGRQIAASYDLFALDESTNKLQMPVDLNRNFNNAPWLPVPPPAQNRKHDFPPLPDIADRLRHRATVNQGQSGDGGK